MNTESLKTFVALARSGNFTKTAQSLYVAQSTVSGRIKELESQLGKPLFFRGKQDVTLTPAGKEFLTYANQIMELEDNAISAVNMIGQFSDSLHIAVPHNLFDCHVNRLVEQFMRMNPDIAVRVSIAHSEEIISHMTISNYDIAFLYSTFHNPNYIRKPFISDQIVLATSSVNTEYCTGIASTQIAELPFVYSQIWELNYNWILPEHRVYALNINVVSKMISYVKASNWYCFFPKKIIEKDLHEGSLIEIPFLDIDLPTKPSFMVYSNSYEKNDALVKLIDLIEQDYVQA